MQEHSRAGVEAVAGGGRGRRAEAVALLSLFAFLVLVRIPRLVLDPRFWVEEGLVYFRAAFHRPWLEALLAPHLGYYALWNNLATVAAAKLVPLAWAPAMTTLFALVAMLAPVWIALLPGSPFETRRERAAVVGLLLLLPSTHTRWLTTQESQFAFGAACGLVLVSRAGGPAGARWIRRLVLGAAALTGAVSVFLTPLFWMACVLRRNRERAVQAAILTGGALVQLSVFWRVGAQLVGSGQRFSGSGPELLLAAVFNQNLVFSLTGRHWKEASGAIGGPLREAVARGGGSEAWLWLLLCGGAVLLALALMTGGRGGDRRGLWLGGCFALVSVLSLVSATTGEEPRSSLVTSQSRYFYPANVFLGCALLLQAERAASPRLRAACAGLVALMLLAGTSEYLTPVAAVRDGPSWRAEVARWRADPQHRLAVWPGPRLSLAAPSPPP